MTHQSIPNKKRFLVASIQPQKLSRQDAFEDLKELKELIDTYDGEVIDYVIQSREAHGPGLYLGTGKIDEISLLIVEKDIDIVVLNALVKPTQLFDIKKLLEKKKPGIQVWDRVDLILNIFSRHANTTEARLQIQLASMKHMGPRIYGMGYVLSRQGGSIGTRGIGETNTELMKRHWNSQMKNVSDKLKKLSSERERQLEYRRRNGLQTISLVGYTNAGKTSLFNALTGKKQLVENALFATLDSHVGKLFLPKIHQEVFISDTIGFIKNLPADLIDAFRSTLMESIHADVLLHVVDIADVDVERKITAVEEVLRELGVHNKPQLYVFNKSDLLSKDALLQLQSKYSAKKHVFISTKTGQGTQNFIEKIETNLKNNTKE